MSRSSAKRRIISLASALVTTRFRTPSSTKYCSISCTPWCEQAVALRAIDDEQVRLELFALAVEHLLQDDVLRQLGANDVSFRVVRDGDRGHGGRRRATIGARKLEKLTRVNGDLRVDSYDKSALLIHVRSQGDIDVRRHETAAGHRHGERRAGERRRQREDRRDDGRLSSRHRCAEAERHRHDLRPARHPDHRPDPHGAGRGHARHLVPPRAARRQRRRDRRLPDAASPASASPCRRPASSTA